MSRIVYDDDEQPAGGPVPSPIPRDEFSTTLRTLRDNPGAIHTQSRVDISDPYGNAVTWTIDTFRVDVPLDKERRRTDVTVFLQRMSADRALRLVLPPAVTVALNRQQDRAITRARRRGARQAVDTKRLKGIPVGNAAGLRKARRARKA